jgi:hypothetical protein
VSLGLNVKSSYAAAQNNRISQEKAYKQYIKYGVYNETELTGSEAISMIRNFYAEDNLTIYVNKDKSGRSLKITKELARQGRGYINGTLTNSDVASSNFLENNITSTATYVAWIVYDGIDVEQFAGYSDEVKREMSQTSYTVTGIVLMQK